MAQQGFLGALPAVDRGEAALLGVPFDGTASFRPGARFGPSAIREASYSLETFSPFMDRDLGGRDYVDWGDLELEPSRADHMVEHVATRVREILMTGMHPVILGGEHTLTLGVIQAMANKHKDLHILQLDAHADFRDNLLGEPIGHATVMKRVSEIVDSECIHRIGIRSGTKDELIQAGIRLPIENDAGSRDIEGLFHSIPSGTPLYITLDLDVFDPSLVPGVGNPEPNGVAWREFIQLIRTISLHNIVGCDITELAPQYDQTGVSSVVAASAVRELMLCMLS